MTTITKRLAMMASLLAVVALPTAAQQPTQRFWDHGVRLTFATRSLGDWQDVTATWGSATDGRLTASSYRVRVTLVHPTIAFPVKQLTTTSPVTVVRVPLRPTKTDSIGLRVTVWASRLGVEGVDSVWGVRWLKRAANASAPRDSFPAGWCCTNASIPWLRKAPAAMREQIRQAQLDTATTDESRATINALWAAVELGPDSVFVAQPALGTNNFNLRIGYQNRICLLGRNNITGKVQVRGADVVADCEALRLAWAATFVPVAMVPFILDTIRPFTLADGRLRPGIAAIDTTNPGRISLDRVDSTQGRNPFRVWIHTMYANMSTDSARIAGALIVSPGSPCTRSVQYPATNAAWDAPMWDIRIPPRIYPYPNALPDDENYYAPPKVILAMAAQLPVDSLGKLARASLRDFVTRDTTWVNGRHWYEECYGPP